MPDNKKYLIQLDGVQGQAVKDSAWYNEKKDDLFKKYPNAQIFEMSDYDENDTRDTDQFAISFKGVDGTAIKDASWYEEKKGALAEKYGNDASVKRLRAVDYWYDKAIADEKAIDVLNGEITRLRAETEAEKEESQYVLSNPYDPELSPEEYASFEKELESTTKEQVEEIGRESGYLTLEDRKRLLKEKEDSLKQLQADYDSNPRVIEYKEKAALAQKEAEEKLSQELRDKISKGITESAKRQALEGPVKKQVEPEQLFELSENGKFALKQQEGENKEGSLAFEKFKISEKQERFDNASGNFSAAESFLDAYDYLKNNKRSVAQGMWYDIWESVGEQEYDAVHGVLKKLEDKYGKVDNISAEQIDKTLNESEKILLQAYFLVSEEEAKTSGAFQGGQIAGSSVLVAGEMLLWSAITAITAGAAAPAAGTGLAVSLGKGAMQVTGNVLKGLGKWALKNSLRSAAFTALAPTTDTHIAKNKLQIDEHGRLMDDTEDVLKYAAQEFIENFTEFSGEGLLKGMKYVGKGLSKIKPVAKLGEAASKVGDIPLGKLGDLRTVGKYLSNAKGMQIAGNMGFQGLPAEIFEEFEGAVFNDISGLDDEALENFFDKDNFGTMLIGFAPMTLFGAGASSLSMFKVSRNMSKSESNLRESLFNVFTEEELNSAIAKAKSANTSVEISAAMDDLLNIAAKKNKKITNAQLQDMTKFGQSVAGYKMTFSGEYKDFMKEVELMQEPYNLGQSLTEANLYEVSEAEKRAKQAVVDTGEFEQIYGQGFTEDALNMTSLEITSLLSTRGAEMSDAAKQALDSLAKAKAVSEGLQDKLNDELNGVIKNTTAISTGAAVNGNLTTAQYNGNTVYVKGSVNIKDGKIVKPEGTTGHPVEIVNITTGEVTVVDSNDLANVKKENVVEFNTKIAAVTTNLYQNKWDAARNKKTADVKLNEVKQMVGQKIYITKADGGLAGVEIQQILPNGDVMIKGKKGDLGGESTKVIPAEDFYNMIARDSNGEVLKDQSEQSYDGGMDFREGVHKIVVNGSVVDAEVISQDDAANRIRYEYTDANGQTKAGSSSISEFEASVKQAESVAAEEAPVANAPELEQPAVEPIPAEELNEPEPAPELEPESINWDELFERDKEAYLAELQNQFGEETLDILNEEIEAAQSELDSISKAKTKSQNERIENRKKKKALQERINILNGMAQRLAASTDIAQEASSVPVAEVNITETPVVSTDASSSIPAVGMPEPVVVPIEKDPEPRNAIEFAARELGLKNGGIKLLVDSFKHHTGYGNTEVRKFFGLFRTKDKGGMTLDEAGERLMEIDREYNLGFFDQSDPNAGLNAILDAIGFNSTMGELRSFTARMVQEEAQREADAVYAYEMEQYEKALDEAHRDEVFTEELMAGKAYTAEEYNELMTILAEEISDYDTGNQGEIDILHEAEDIGDLPASEGEAYGGIEGSNQILQEAQPVQTSGERDSQRRGANQDFIGEDANSQVYNGESSNNERGSSKEGFVSSFDEDMPDFTTETKKVPVAPNPVANPVEAAKEREKSLIALIERRGVDKNVKIDSARNAGRQVADMFPTREAYDEYLAEAGSLGEYEPYFNEGVDESFAKRDSNSFHIGNILHKATDAFKLATDTAIKLLEKVGLKPIRVSNEQAAEMLSIIEEVSQTPVEKMTVYHGSPHLFEEFDHSNMGRGEGAQAHGWGTYVATSRETGEGYASALRGTPRIIRNGQDVTSHAKTWMNFAKTPMELVVTFIDQFGINEARERLSSELKNIEQRLKDNASPFIAEELEAKAEMYRNASVLMNRGSWSTQQSPARLYTVDIPDNNGKNYLNEDAVTDEQMEMITDACEREGVDFLEVAAMASQSSDIRQGARLYEALTSVLGSARDASEFLSRAGFTGISYEGRVDGDCFVIFNESDAKVKGRTEMYQTPDGTIYGWTDGKNIYLTEAGINPNTPIHEYTHLWVRAMMKQNPKGWNSIKNLLKGTPIWDEVVNDPNYSKIKEDEDAVASEALSRLSGSKNAAKLEQIAQQMIDEAKGNMQKVKARGLIQNIKDALNKFWGWVGKNLFGIENFNSIDEITDRVLYDLVNQTDLGEFSEGQVETQVSTDATAIKDEIAAIKEQSVADGTFKKAPNGKSTNLSEEQWIVVRTKAFKKWFGDWELGYLYKRAMEAWNNPSSKGKFVAQLSKKARGRFNELLGNDAKQFIITDDSIRHIKKEHSKGEELRGQKNLTPEDIVILPYLVNNFDSMELVPEHNDNLGNRAVLIKKRINGISFIGTIERGKNKEFLVTNYEFIKSDALDASNETPERNVRNDSDITNVRKDIENIKSLAINSSKVVDENGEPLVVYHGTGKDFYTFRDTSSSNELGSGYYFTDSYETAERYAVDEDLADNRDRIDAAAYDIFSQMGYTEEDMNDNEYIDKYNEAYAQAVKEVFANSHVKAVFLNIKDPYVIGTSERSPYDETYDAHSNNDGIIDKEFSNRHDSLEGNQYVAFNPNQIKSADPVTYDDTGNVIPLSERFNPENSDIRYRKADVQNAAVDYLTGGARNEVIENAVNEEAEKLGVKVTYKTREQMEKGHENDKGYYDTRTGEIVICTENASSIADAIQTILHEAVAHKGLRALMGDKFNQFINRVYNSLDAKTKAEVDALAEKEYDGNTAVAMEEYMATLAESENFAEQTIWEKIKTIFNNIINSLLGRNDIKIGDSELRYLLGASYNNMVNPNGMQTLEGWAKDLLMRENYGISEVNTATPDILSRTGIDPTQMSSATAAQNYSTFVNNVWQEAQRQLQDADQPVRIAIDAIQQETGNIPIEDYENYLLIHNHASSRSRVEVDTFRRKYYDPLVSAVNDIISHLINSRGIADNAKNRAEVYKEVRQYLIAKHGLERNKLYQETREKMRDYSGLTALFGLAPSEYEKAEALAQKMVDDFETALGRETNEDGEIVSQSAAIDALWSKINAATDKTLRHSYECGLISRQQYNDIKSMFKFYVPLRGFDETTAEDVYAYSRFTGNSFSPTMYSASGRSSVADDPIATIMTMAESEISQGNNNRAKQALYSYLLNRTTIDAEGNPKQNSLMQIESVWYVFSKDSDGNDIYTIATPRRNEGETLEQFEQRMQKMAEAGEAVKSAKGKVDVGMRFQKRHNENQHYIYLKVNGVEKAIYINGDPKAADAINGRYHKKEGYENIRKINRFLSSMFTNYSLEFTVRNLIRDAIYSRINIAMKETDPAYKKKFRANWWHNMFKVLGMLKRYRAGMYDNAELNETERMFIEFMENGGQTGYTLINSVERNKEELEKMLKNMRAGSKKGIKNTSKAKALFKGIEVLNESSELVTRFSAYQTSREMGRGVEQSVKDAKEITVNFNTKGAQDGTGFLGWIARWFGATKYFFNASVQGVQNLALMAQKGKGKFGKVVCSLMATGALMPIVQGALASLLGYGDDEDYWNIPEYDRQNNICILIGGGDYIKIPLPVGFREMYAIGDMVMASACDRTFDRDIADVAVDMANKIASVVLPINPLEGTANGLSLIESAAVIALPDAADFAFQWITNTDFKGAPLQKEYGYNAKDPEWTKAFSNNPAWLTGLSKWCYELWPEFNWSPEKIDNTLSNLFGGMYSITKKTARAIEDGINGDLNAGNIPVVGIFFGEGEKNSERFLSSAYWEMNDYYEDRIAEVKRVANAFGYTLDDVYKRVPEGKVRAGEHNPEMSKIYNSSYFDFDWMQEWYLGNYGEAAVKHGVKTKTPGISQMRSKINELKREITSNKNGEPTKAQANELSKLQNQFDEMFEDFVYDMLELD